MGQPGPMPRARRMAHTIATHSTSVSLQIKFAGRIIDVAGYRI